MNWKDMIKLAMFNICISIGVVLLGVLFVTFLMWATPVEGRDDEPIIATEFHGQHDSITVGTVGDDAINLYTRESRRDSMTIGTVGDRVILINHRPSRFRSKLNIRVEEDLFLIEDLGNPLEESRDE